MKKNAAALTVKTVYSENSLNIKDIIEKTILAYIEKEALKNSNKTIDVSSEKN